MYIMACYLFIIKILHADNSFLFFFIVARARRRGDRPPSNV
jgi:hypothetical protein